MKKNGINKLGYVLFIITVLVFSAVLVFSCDEEEKKTNDNGNGKDKPIDPDLEVFTSPPVLNIVTGIESLTVMITDSNPPADFYEIYWKQGNASASELKSSGTQLYSNLSLITILHELTDGETYSIIATAIKNEYNDKDSAVATGKPGRERSSKRGVSYNFNFPRPSNSGSGSGHNNTAIATRDMDLLGQGITWFYDWGTNPSNNTGAGFSVAALAEERGIEYAPMIFRGSTSFNGARSHAREYPRTKYVLAFNEPNFLEEANMSPQQAANVWTALVDNVKAENLKLISPAMGYGTNPIYNYNPTLWLEMFFGTDGQPGFPNVSLDHIDGVAIHLYNDFGDNVRGYINRFRKFGKPIWMTEWCAWDDKAQTYLNNMAFQVGFMSQSVMLMEHDPAIERYAWFIPKGGTWNSEELFPYNKLLTAPPTTGTTLPELTALGLVYVHMSTLDKSFYFVTGQQIPAKDFSNGNISELVPNASTPYISNTSTWRDGVRFTPTTDNAAGASVLDIVFHSGRQNNNPTNMWVEYQVAVPETKAYTFTVRHNAAMTFEVSVNGEVLRQITLQSTSTWRNNIDTLQLPAGLNTIRFRKTSAGGECSINWFRLD